MARSNRTSKKDLDSSSMQDVVAEFQKKKAEELEALERSIINKNAKFKKEIELKNTQEKAQLEKKLNEQLAKQASERRKELLNTDLEAYIAASDKHREAAIAEYKAEIDQLRNESKANLGKSLLSGDKSGANEATLNLIRSISPTLSGVVSGLVAASDAIKLAGKIADDVVQSSLSIYKDYADRVNTRLIGVGKTFKDVADQTTKFTSLYSNKEYLTNVATLVEQGIVTNVEQRAFLMTIKDSVVTTFDAQNETLRRLVRIQHEDSTAARMGMEGYLNNFLNTNYQNSEYLTSLFDTVSVNIEEATSLLSAEEAVSTEYAIQKWLGALYSSGMSQAGIQAIAGALGQLGSGNINSLVGTNIGNLMAMASKGQYGTYLKDGLSEATVNILMGSLVNYLKQINEGNNVVKSQLANTFGLSISDLKSVSGINTSALGGDTLSYKNAQSALYELMGSAGDRISTAERIDNFMENMKFAFGSNIVENSAAYGLYTAGNVASSLLGDDSLIANLIKTGSLLSSAINFRNDILGGALLAGDMLSTFSNLGKLSLSTGSGFSLLSGVGESLANAISNNSSSDIFKNSLSNTKQELIDNKKQLQGVEGDIGEYAVQDIRDYLIKSFDEKMDALLQMTASASNYSYSKVAASTLGTSGLSSSFTDYSSVKVEASGAPTETAASVAAMDSNISLITTLLQSVINNGTLRVSVNESYGSTTVGLSSSSAKQWGYTI